MPASPPASFWDDLLEYIEDRRVVPIVGAELLRVPDPNPDPDGGGGGDVPIDAVVARRLAARLGVPAGGLPPDDALHAVVARHLAAGGRRDAVYPRLYAALRDAPLPVPPALRKLAAVRPLRLFVTTSVFPLLERALDDARPPGTPSAAVVAYAPNDVQDLPAPIRDLDRPTVFHLLGRASATPRGYALTDDDVLEFLAALQSDERRPKTLFKELRSHHLLLIGNKFPDWLARFFIRLAKGGRLSDPRDATEVLADRVAGADPKLVLFLRNFSPDTQVYAGGGAIAFVDELAERYAARHPHDGMGAAATGPRGDPADAAAGDGSPDVLPPGAVFLSYASGDRPAVQRLHDALQAVGVDAWYDRRQLEAGDDYALKIRRNVKACSLFVPVVSATTQGRVEGFFRREWKWAADRAEDFAAGVPFVVPVCVDDTCEADAMVPDKFLDAHWARLPGGEVSPDFAQRMVRLIREYRKRQQQQRGAT